VQVLSAAHDRHPANNRGVIAIAAAREPRVLYIEGELAAAASFARALEAEKLQVEVRGARGVPSRAELDRYDLVILSDVPRAALGDKQMQVVESFVRDGGGLIVSGGVNSFGSGGYAGSRLEGLLPVRLDLTENREEATLALGLVIDKSGSMSGSKMDLTKEAARATAEMMPPSDQIAVVVFDSQALPIVRLQRAANRIRILSDIGRIQASGGTNILAGLREGVDELLAARARKKHIILLSDGQSSYDGISDLVETAAGAQITISTVGVGEGADQTLLQMIATRGGGRFYQTRDPSTIPRIFSRETSQVGRSSLVEEPTAVRVKKRGELLGGLEIESAPKLRGYVLTRPRAQADLFLSSGRGDPLLARWQVGLGQVAAWTSDVKPRWSADFMRWPGFPKFWAQLARTTMRRRAASHFPLRVTLEGETVSASVDAVGTDDRFLSGLEGTLEVIHAAAAADEGGDGDADGRGDGASKSASGQRRKVTLTEMQPGRYEASFPVPRSGVGAFLLTATLRRRGTPVAEATGRLALPVAPELRPRIPRRPTENGKIESGTPGKQLLAALAARTGGRVVMNPGQVFDAGADRKTSRRGVRTPILLVTMGLFLLDVLLRRVRLPGSWRNDRPAPP
jgi:uncharacterized membrane protein